MRKEAMDARMLLLFLSTSILLASQTLVGAQSSAGFINIDCGKKQGYNSSTNGDGLTYSSDFEYIDTGEIHSISSKYSSQGDELGADLRSFPNGSRNCYTLMPIEQGRKYRVRAKFLYGNYDGLDKVPRFDLHLGVNFWVEVSFANASEYFRYDIMAVAVSDFLSLCLVNTDQGTPFVSAIEVRPLSDDFYPLLSSLQAFRDFYLGDAGGDADYGYPYDIYDRIWKPLTFSNWRTINRTSVTATEPGYQPPSQVMRTASTPTSASYLSFYLTDVIDARLPKPNIFFIAMHFAELQPLDTSQSRIFDIYINNKKWQSNVKPVFLKTTTLSSDSPESYDKMEFNISQAVGSTSPPILNAIEVYRVLDFSGLETAGGDVAAMLEIRGQYNVKRNWMGDPCAPKDFLWDGLNCSYIESSNPRITSLNLSSSGLTGEIPTSLGNLTQLQYLDLSKNKLTGGIPNFLASLPQLKFLDLTGNKLTGPIPKGLHYRITSGVLTLRIENPEFQDENKKNNSKTVIAAVAGSIVAVMILVVVGLLFFRRWKGTRKIDSPQVQQENKYAPNETIPDEEPILMENNRQFSHDELAKITRNFTTVIGEGGFGVVYLGDWRDGTQVAVKVLSKASLSQGQKQFQNEAVLLSKIYHKNLVSLVGYCSEPRNLALVYEYMEQGSIHDHLSDKAGSGELFGWKKRLEIAIGAAQGLQYLHEGCKMPIVHRDIKPQNILLDGNMQAKIADFGLSKIFESDTKSYVTTAVVGTPGYLDPEFSSTQMLTAKSDVYNFGVVLLQLVTGLPAIQTGVVNVHIIDIVLQRYQDGVIEDIVDRRFDGVYDINSIWKMLEIALACASRSSVERPSMGEVLAQLKICLSLEASNGDLYPNSGPHSVDPISVDEVLFEMHAR